MQSLLQYLYQIKYLLGDDRRKISGLVFLFLLSSVLDLIGLGLIGPYVAIIANPSDIVEAQVVKDYLIFFGIHEEYDFKFILGVALIIVFGVKSTLSILINKKVLWFSYGRESSLRSYLMNAYQKMPYTDYLQRNSSEYIHTVQQLTSLYASSSLLPLLRIVSESLVGIVLLGALIWINGFAVLLLVGLLGLMVLLYDRLFRSKLKEYGKRVSDASIEMVRGVHEGIEGLKEIRVLGVEDYFYRVVKENAAKYSNNHVKSQIISIAPRYLIEFALVLFVVALVVSTSILEYRQEELIATLGVFGMAALRLMPSVNTIISGSIQMRFARHGVSRLYTDIRQVDNINDNEPACDHKSGESNFLTLSIKDLSFTYFKASRPALSNISMEIKAGESIGLIGESGSGKTTLVDVFLGLLSYQHGEIKYNGVHLSHNLNTWLAQVAYLPQQIFIIDDTLRHNVTLGEDDDKIDNDRLMEAIRQSHLEELVSQLPQGVETLLGERGARISGGQRQRVALARAFYHQRNILIMDEATSALDTETECEIVEEIRRFKGKKTMIVIAHRLTTVRHCDRIYRMKNGFIVEEGDVNKMIPTETEI